MSQTLKSPLVPAARRVPAQQPPAGAESMSLPWLLVCCAMVAGSVYLRLVVYPNEVVPLAYALPLLLCLWSRDVRLLWGMAAAFLVLVLSKAAMLPDYGPLSHKQWFFAGMQVLNVLVPAAMIHAAIRLNGRLDATITHLEQVNSELEHTNEELAAREEEITQQNEELQSQAEELQLQTEELQSLNEQLAVRERTLSDLLETSSGGASESELLAKLGEMVRRLLGARACAAAVLEPLGVDMGIHPLDGVAAEPKRLKRDRTLAELVLTRDRAGFVADLGLRPDLECPRLEGAATVRSVAGAPIHVGDGVAGVLEVYSTEPGDWSEHELRVGQWLAEQCGRMWTTARLREELEKQRRLLRTVTDTATVGLFMTDERGHCTYLSPAAERLTGHNLKSVAEAPLHEILRVQQPFQAADGRTGEGGRTWEDEIRRSDGSFVPVFVSVNSVSPSDAAGGLVIELRDASQQRQHEEERELLLEAERAARAESERANRAKDEFVATLSHELRTPLNAVLGWAALLRKNASSDPAEVLKAVEIIERNARLQSQLISDLLDMNRIMTGKIRLDVQSVDVPLVVESALESVRLAAEARGVVIERVIETVDRAVMGDPNRLQQVVWNLLSNAIKFTPRGGRVQVVVSRVASYVQIAVSDTGDGIDPELLPHIFERYRQGDGSSTRLHGGLGLGLAITRHLVELHGGSIYAKSDGLGKGASFAVLLPVQAVASPATAEAPHPLSEAALRLDANAPSLAGLSILVVDDEEDARDLISRILKDRGAVVQAVSSGQEALNVLTEAKPDLLVSDVGMPRMDGYALVRAIRERWPEWDVPGIALTAFARSEDRTRALLAGFQSHIAKPVEAAELVATVASLYSAISGAPARRRVH